jgi:hypothetical protein
MYTQAYVHLLSMCVYIYVRIPTCTFMWNGARGALLTRHLMHMPEGATMTPTPPGDLSPATDARLAHDCSGIRILCGNGTILLVDRTGTGLSLFLRELRTPLYDCVESHLPRADYRKVYPLLQEHLSHPLTEHEGVVPLDPVRSALDQCIQDGDPTQRALLLDIRSRAGSIFKPVAHSLPFIPDATLVHVATFLNIAHATKCDEMFDELPDVLRSNYRSQAGIHSLVELVESPALHPHIRFIEERTDQELLDLARASCLLAIRALSVLVGCRLSMTVARLSEEEFRVQYSIPSMFKSDVHQRAEDLCARSAQNARRVPLQSPMLYLDNT